MKLKTKVSLILIFLVIAVCSLFAACQIGGKSWREILGDAQYQYITYYAGGGTFGNSKVVKNIYYEADVPATSEFEITNTDWLFKGWFYVELDGEGNPKFASEENKKAGIPELTDREAVFPLTLSKDDHLYLGAKWTRDYKLKYFLYDSPDITIDGKVYSNGEEFTSSSFGKYDYINLSYSKLPVESSDSTLLEYYVEDGQGGYKVLDGAIEKPDVYDETDEDPFVSVYCKFVSGLWEMVRTASDVRIMYQNLAFGNSYYVTQDIDCSNNQPLTLKAGSINCIIQGNGHTISNQSFESKNLANGGTSSIFGEISKDTVMKDITFENFTSRVTIRSGARVNIYLFSHGIEAGADLQNVAFNNSSLTIPSVPNTSTINNIQNIGGVYQTDAWVSGDGDYSSVRFRNLTLDVAGQTDTKYQEN